MPVALAARALRSGMRMSSNGVTTPASGSVSRARRLAALLDRVDLLVADGDRIRWVVITSGPWICKSAILAAPLAGAGQRCERAAPLYSSRADCTSARGGNMIGIVQAGCAVALLLLAAPAWGSGALRGVVVRDRERGAPVAGVQLTASGANPVTTGNDGQFVLTFPQGHAGQDVTVRVSRAGWEVVNDVLLDRQLPDPTSGHVFEIIVCVSAEREQRRMEFYRLKGNEAVERTYRAKLAELEGRHTATVQERDRLLRERDEVRKQVEDWARQAAARRPDEVGGAYKEALRLFIDGKSEDALQRLSDERLQQEVARAQEQLKQVVAGWLLKGQLLTTKFDYEAAGQAYEHATTVAPSSLVAWSAYASFHQRQNHFQMARRGYEKTLALARQAFDSSAIAWTLNKLGTLSREEHHTAEARKVYEGALALYRSLASQNPEVYRPDLAMTLNNLGALSSEEHRTAEARKSYEEALAVYRTLASQNPEVRRPDLARTLNNLGALSRDEHRTAEARKAYEEALGLYRSLASENPEVYRPDLARTLNKFGALSRDEHRTDDARKAYEESLGLYRLLASQNPEVYRPDLTRTLNNVDVRSRDERRTDEVRRATRSRSPSIASLQDAYRRPISHESTRASNNFATRTRRSF
ncbi:MAG TPA: tetratricopeptide repeat protein [Kofleriaceae bacterium]|nr:tetratricopeptide repeat protein [Kofleriaceae bacterium]